MKIINNKTILVSATNAILFVIFLVVFCVSFFPENIVPIYSSERYYAVYNGNKEKPNVSFMFNVYENTKVVNEIINTLNEYNVKATFFVGGCWADDNAETLNKIKASNLEIANHGYFHKDHKKLNYEQNVLEIQNTSKIVEGLCGVKTKLFAPPSGSFSDLTLEASYNLEHTTIMWSKDTIDWRDHSVDLVFYRATNNLQNGDLILMHPKEHTLKALPKIITYCIENGFTPVTVSENIKGTTEKIWPFTKNIKTD